MCVCVCVCAAEAVVVVKQEKKEETARVVPESEKRLHSCFCPDGYSTANAGHYHCRHCGISCRYSQNILRHEKVHRDFIADKADPSRRLNTRYHNCQYCAYLSRDVWAVQRHEKRVHNASQAKQVTDDRELETPSAASQNGTGILLETTAKGLRVGGNCTIGQFSLLYTVSQKKGPLFFCP